MRLSPPFDNTAPASVTPGRGGSFANSTPDGKALGLGTQQSNTTPATNTSFPRAQLRASPDNTLPTTKFQSNVYWAAGGAVSFSPSNGVARQLRNGLVFGNEPLNGYRDSEPTGSFFGNVFDARLHSFAITPQTTYPLLLATSGGFSFYATTAGVTNTENAFGSTMTISGSALITGTNGYRALGTFLWYVTQNDDEGGSAPTDPTLLEIWADETGLAAQPTNTPPQPRQ